MSNLGALDMALDDVISKNRTNNRSNNKNRNTRGGISKRSTRPSSLPHKDAKHLRPNTRLADSRPTANNNLVVANLHFNVTEKDLYDLFGQIGTLKRAFLHIGPNGKSAGIADIVFVKGNDAEKAKNTYNNVELDGRPMRITSASIGAAISQRTTVNNRSSNLRGNSSARGGNSSARGRRNDHGNDRGNDRGKRSGNSRSKPSEQDLDADMDSYMNPVSNEDVNMN